MRDPIIDKVRRIIGDARAANSAFGVGFPKATVDCNVLERICKLAEIGMQIYREKMEDDPYDVVISDNLDI